MQYTATTNLTEKDMGRKIKFYLDDGTLHTGTIASYPNEDHTRVLVDHKYEHWEWYVRNEAILFV